MSKLAWMCEQDNCELPKEGRTSFCSGHNKMIRDIARDLSKPVKQPKPLRRMPVQKISEKHVRITERLHDVYEAMDEEERSKNGGCYIVCQAYPREYNDHNAIIDHSHTISRARCKQLGKPELIYDPANIEHCSRQAHTEWDNYSPEIVKHANFQKRMDYIKQYDMHDYERRMAIWAAANRPKETV